MGKADRRRAQNARERIAAQQAAAKRAEARRRMLIAGGSVVVVIAVVVGFILAKALSKPQAAAAGKTAAASATSNSAVASEISSVPASAFNSVGAGPTGSGQVSALVPVSGSPLTSGGKPEMLYVGAEYCPYCAAERWAMAVALSRFGTFTNLHFIHSESSDIYSNTATLTFYQSSYTSKYLVFTPVETTTTTGAALQSPTTAQLTLMNAYDAPPYVPSADKDSFPFVDIGNKYIADGAQFLPSVLGSPENPDPTHFGLSWAQIGQDLKNPNNAVSQAILASANHITAAICKLTNGQPGNVCSSAAVTSVGSRI
jgi:thiol-disulfide isomerase/thioredoxin